MKRFHSICQGTNIQSQIQKQNKQQAKCKLTTLIIDNYQVHVNSQKHLTTSTNRAASFKKTSYYHQFIHNFRIKKNQYTPSAENNPQNADRDILLQKQLEESPILKKKFSRISEINCGNTDYEFKESKQGKFEKIKSFYSFLKNKQKQNQSLCSQPNKRRKAMKITQGFTPRQEFFFKLSGKTITKLSPQSQTSKRINVRRLVYSKTKQSRNDLKISSYLQKQTFAHLNLTHNNIRPLLNYFREEQEQYLFDKIMNPLSIKRPTCSNKKIAYFNNDKALCHSKLSEKGNQKYATNTIEGWDINSLQEEQLL